LEESAVNATDSLIFTLLGVLSDEERTEIEDVLAGDESLG